MLSVTFVWWRERRMACAAARCTYSGSSKRSPNTRTCGSEAGSYLRLIELCKKEEVEECPNTRQRALHVLREQQEVSQHPHLPPEREFFIDNLLVRIHFIIVTIRWTGLAPWEFEFPFPGSLKSAGFRGGRGEALPRG